MGIDIKYYISLLRANSSFSDNGAEAIIKDLISCGVKKFDYVAIRSTHCEFNSAIEACEELGIEYDQIEFEDDDIYKNQYMLKNEQEAFKAINRVGTCFYFGDRNNGGLVYGNGFITCGI